MRLHRCKEHNKTKITCFEEYPYKVQEFWVRNPKDTLAENCLENQQQKAISTRIGRTSARKEASVEMHASFHKTPLFKKLICRRTKDSRDLYCHRNNA